MTDIGRIPNPTTGSLPGAFVSPAAVRRHGWEPNRSGWLVEARSALTDAQRTAAKDLAVDAGLTVETMDERASLSSLRSGATAAGMLLALGVLAMTVGLIRSEMAGDLRTLAAMGASSGMRRKLTAATAGSLALLGVVLGSPPPTWPWPAPTSATSTALAPRPRSSTLPSPRSVCRSSASAAGWLLAGRQPPAIARAALD